MYGITELLKLIGSFGYAYESKLKILNEENGKQIGAFLKNIFNAVPDDINPKSLNTYLSPDLPRSIFLIYVSYNPCLFEFIDFCYQAGMESGFSKEQLNTYFTEKISKYYT